MLASSSYAVDSIVNCARELRVVLFYAARIYFVFFVVVRRCATYSTAMLERPTTKTKPNRTKPNQKKRRRRTNVCAGFIDLANICQLSAPV